MTQQHERFAAEAASLHYETDVLVIGGGPAGCWAALTAAARGARVILVDKGYCGSSGATAPSGTGVWYVAPDPAKRSAAKLSRDALGGQLADHAWMDRVLDRTYDNINLLAEWGYPFPRDDDGAQQRRSLQGPEYMRLMRRRVKEAGVKILDHSPALELLVDEEGTVAGAQGVRRQLGERWSARAKAVVMASGGCAFLSKALGCNVLTGDGHLMAAEAGADLSGMEFSNAYAIAPAFASVTKTLFYNWASFTREDGTPIPGASAHHRSVIACARCSRAAGLCAARARPTKATRTDDARRLRSTSFPAVRSRRHRPVHAAVPRDVASRGHGARHPAACASSMTTARPSVRGLYAAGDAATRELICGGFTGGGSHNAAWAMSSGAWAGAGAANFARQLGHGGERRSAFSGVGGTALTARAPARIGGSTRGRACSTRSRPKLRPTTRTTSAPATCSSSRSSGSTRRGAMCARRTRRRSTAVVKAREAAAMLATARWMYRSALARHETRGMHKREDFPKQDPGATPSSIATGGLDEVWTRTVPASQVERTEAAA